ncbi:MAG: tRNA (adenosine(37)-N6)-dimethylallyltransferase MiaA [Spirochaetes bacterium]|nr:tRNA (adenosine(37)-N6)-dimethylallyltransferase MiaA [Spirochaetota bacterium]
MGGLPLVLLFGPTGVGKTELILRLFAGIGEVISADSMQVYKGLDIGTAKPSLEVRSQVPHHLIDILDPREQYTAGEFVHRAEELIPQIDVRGRIPIISGGTAYYFKNFLYGLPETPVANPSVREWLDQRLELEGLPRLYEELKRIDPVAGERISPRDTYRILRALEVYYSTGRALSSYAVPVSPRLGRSYRLIGLIRDRKELYQRIDARVEEMFKQGLPEEVARLIALGYGEEDPGMRGIGYREFFQLGKEGCLTLSQVKTEIQKNSRRYAKRQITFFKSLPGVQWLHPNSIRSLKDLGISL